MRECCVTLNYDALKHNLAIVKSLAPSAGVVAMVKANAYGHGLVNVAKVLDQHVDYLGVACLTEGIQLRQAGCKTNILLMEGFFNTEELYQIRAYDLSVVLHELWQVEALLHSPNEKKLDVWLKFDSGMHRLGFNCVEFSKAIESLSHCQWVSNRLKLMTHFACADEIDSTFTQTQYQSFINIAKKYPIYALSTANSAAILSFPDCHHQFVRPGLMLYGASPLTYDSAKGESLQPVMTFSSKIIALRDCPTGDSVGYGAAWHASSPSKIATVAVGYGDGYPRHINQDAVVLVGERRASIVGRVSMDMMSIDVSHIPDVYIGQSVVLWGEGLPINEVANFSNTISYDLLCRMGLKAYR